MAGGRQIEWSTPATKLAAERITSVRLHAIFGGLLGLSLGMAGGMARRSIGAASIAALVGAGLGASLAGTTTYFVLPVYWRYRQWNSGDLGASLVLHAGIWSGIGLAGGLALGLGLGDGLRPLKTAVGGFSARSAVDSPSTSWEPLRFRSRRRASWCLRRPERASSRTSWSRSWPRPAEPCSPVGARERRGKHGPEIADRAGEAALGRSNPPGRRIRHPTGHGAVNGPG